jgi:hypothetical protein
MIDIAVVDYGMGNLRSVAKALKHVAPERTIVVSGDPDTIRSAARIVLPGQSAMPDCIRSLNESGLRDVVMDLAGERPFLGICLGLQMLFDASEEGPTPGLGVLRGRVVRFRDEQMLGPGRRAAQGAAHGMEPGAAGPAAPALGRDRRRHALLLRAQLLSRTRRSRDDGGDGRLSVAVYLRHRAG